MNALKLWFLVFRNHWGWGFRGKSLWLDTWKMFRMVRRDQRAARSRGEAL